MDPMTPGTPQAEEEVLDEVRTQEPAKVILFNDEIHTFDEVITQLIKAINCTQPRAEALAVEVHPQLGDVGIAALVDGVKTLDTRMTPGFKVVPIPIPRPADGNRPLRVELETEREVRSEKTTTDYILHKIDKIDAELEHIEKLEERHS